MQICILDTSCWSSLISAVNTSWRPFLITKSNVVIPAPPNHICYSESYCLVFVPVSVLSSMVASSHM